MSFVCLRLTHYLEVKEYCEGQNIAKCYNGKVIRLLVPIVGRAILNENMAVAFEIKVLRVLTRRLPEIYRPRELGFTLTLKMPHT